jgi:hypothetical protein
MPMWRCPHCGTPQAETARCWVCHRSTTACATCRHFRRSVAAQLGYCGLDRARLPLRGNEIRACWEAAIPIPDEPDVIPSRPVPTTPAAPIVVPDRTPVRKLEFVEVGTGRPIGEGRPARRRASPPEVTAVVASASGASVAAAATDTTKLQPGPDEPRWSLWSDGEV